ncbi:MAG: hypothetical protein HQL37_11650 [Alphaproteobacteria bacterium]|nr:hypothetical protein [Alphaproteobacteria bacterium]
MTDEHVESEYMVYFRSAVKAHMQERAAENAAFAAAVNTGKLVRYVDAIQKSLPVLFGSNWVGFVTEDEKAALEYGPGCPGYVKYCRRHALREAQVGRAENWLMRVGWEEKENGDKQVNVADLDAALADAATGEQGKRADEATAPPSALHPSQNVGRKRGPKTRKTTNLTNKLLSDLQAGTLTPNKLREAKEEAAVAEYHVSRETYRKARNAALSEFVGISNSDK